jgi:hypothetical protein
VISSGPFLARRKNILAVIGAALWSSQPGEARYFGFLFLAGFGAGLFGVKPWWTGLALAIIPVGASIYHLTHVMRATPWFGDSTSVR